MSQTMPTHRPIFDNNQSKKQPQPQPSGRSANIVTPDMIRKVEISILGLDSTASPFSGYNSVNSHVSSASMSSSRTYENPRENPAMQPFVREIVQFEVNERYKTLLEKNQKLEEQLKQSQKKVEQIEMSFSRNLAEIQSQRSQLDLSEISSTMSQRDNDQLEELSRQCGGMRGDMNNLQKQVNEDIKQQLAQTAETLQKKDQKIQEYLDAMELKYEQKLALIDQQLKVFSQSKSEGKDGEKLEGVDEMAVKRLEVEQLQVQSELARLKGLMEASKVDYVQVLNQSVDEKMVKVNSDFSEIKQSIAQLREEMGSRIESLNNSMVSENLESSRRKKENDENSQQAKMLEQLTKNVSDLQSKRTAVEDIEKENRELKDRLLKFQRDTSTQMEEMRRLILSNPQIMMEANRSGFINNNANINRNQYNQYDEIPSEFQDLKRDDNLEDNKQIKDGYDLEEDQDQVEIATFGSRDEPEFVPRKFIGDDSHAFYEKQRTLTESGNLENDSINNQNSYNYQNNMNQENNPLLPTENAAQNLHQFQYQQQNNELYQTVDEGAVNKAIKEEPVEQQNENYLNQQMPKTVSSNISDNTNNQINFNQDQRSLSNFTQPILQQQRTSLQGLESKENSTSIGMAGKLNSEQDKKTSLFSDIISKQSQHSKTKSEGTIPAEYSYDYKNHGSAYPDIKEYQQQPQSKDDSNLNPVYKESQPFMVTEYSHQTILNNLGFQTIPTATTTKNDDQVTQAAFSGTFADQSGQIQIDKPNQPVDESIQKQVDQNNIQNQVQNLQQTMMASFGAPKASSLQQQQGYQDPNQFEKNNIPNPLIDSLATKETVENPSKQEQNIIGASSLPSQITGDTSTQSDIKVGEIKQNQQKLEPEEIVNIHEGDNEHDDHENQQAVIVVNSRSTSSEEGDQDDKNDDERVVITVTQSEIIKQSTDITQKENNGDNAGSSGDKESLNSNNQNIGNLQENKNDDAQPESTTLSDSKGTEEQIKQLAQSSQSEYDSQYQKNQDQDDEEEVIYQLDENGYLMDENNNYILDDNGQMVKLGEEEIKYLRQTNMLDES